MSQVKVDGDNHCFLPQHQVPFVFPCNTPSFARGHSSKPLLCFEIEKALLSLESYPSQGFEYTRNKDWQCWPLKCYIQTCRRQFDIPNPAPSICFNLYPKILCQHLEGIERMLLPCTMSQCLPHHLGH